MKPVTILDRIRDRRPVADHDGRSGATIERGILDDGTEVYVKTAEVAGDVGLLLTGDARRELRLWRSGVLDDLPAGVGSALIAVEDHGERLVTVSRDLGSSMLTWDRVLDRSEVKRIFAAITAVHRRHVERPPAGLCPLETRLALFAPAGLDTVARANPDLAAAVRRGHEVFAELVPPDVVDAVHRAYEQPTPLARAMSAAPATLLHGDFALVNVALEPELVTLLDWGLATAGPAGLDLITFCLGAMSNVAVERARLLGDARDACLDLVDDEVWRLFPLWALMELGWNKALDAVDHPDPAKRATERADLDFWVDRARHGLAAGV